ncbi:mechanosensitive ion channel [Pseudohalioglobus sediminis]|uniref:Small-conductance mechanosensitive channel n=2 Tax=Pseudohalioglobus sediminis TaxID=2606449 RepID=A0A5B0X5N7_9GAMM|nr:mechanosensitive ion channel [Pseudohalioglobus sediminis]
MTEAIERDIQELGRLDAQIAAAGALDREALVYRRDQRNLHLVKDMGKLVSAVTQLPEDDPGRESVAASLAAYLQAGEEVLLRRIEELEKRIESLRTAYAEQSGAAQIATEAHLQSLQSSWFRYYEALMDLVEYRQKLGQSETGLRERLLPQLYQQAETLAGRIDANGAALKILQQRKSDAADNTDLNAAVDELLRAQSIDMGNLESTVGLLERLGDDPVAYRAVLLEQGQGLSIATLETGALGSLLDDSWTALKESLAANAPDFLLNLLLFAVIVLVFRALARLVKRAVRSACERPGTDISTLLKEVLVSVCGSVVMVVGILIGLAQVGISLGPMLAGLGVAGFVVGFALQDTLSNFAAGGMILAYRPYDVDDYVEVAGASGLVKKMSLVSTTITTFDNQTLVVPNSKIWGDVIKNVTAQKVRRVDLVFGIGYGDDIPTAEQILQDVVTGHDKVLEKPETMIKVHELADSSVNFVVRPWVKTEDYWDVYWDITREVKMRFDREGVSIPFPQRDVHVYREDA